MSEPKPEPRYQWDNQVGGRAQITPVFEDHLLKPTSLHEVLNYLRLPREIAEVGPKCCLVVLNGEIIRMHECEDCKNSSKTIEEFINSQPKGYYLLMKNDAHGMRKPRLLDLKLGTRTFSDYITEARKKHHILKALGNTTSILGLRLCGASFHGTNEGEIVKWSRAWGKVMAADEFVTAMTQFFDVSDLQKEGALSQLKKIKVALMSAPAHRFFGSSLLVMIDDDDDYTVKVKLIDFASMACSAPGQPQYKGVDEGAVLGIDNMIQIIQQ